MRDVPRGCRSRRRDLLRRRYSPLPTIRIMAIRIMAIQIMAIQIMAIVTRAIRTGAIGKMARSSFRATGSIAALFAACALLISAWGLPAEADPGGGGALKFVGASHAQDLNYASCMRRHGVADFPDPSTDGVFSLINIDPNTSQYRSAENACQKVLPKVNPPSPAEQAKFLQKALAFAQCMRSHGEPTFRDPTVTNGGISFSLSGLDLSAPQFQRAQQACQRLAPFAGGAPPAP